MANVKRHDDKRHTTRMPRRPDSVISFVETRLEDLDMSAFQFELKTGDRFRHLKSGKQRPPIATLHKWAEVLQLDRAGRLRLFELVDEAHGGGTILRWVIDEVNRLEKQAEDGDRLIAKLSKKLDGLERGA